MLAPKENPGIAKTSRSLDTDDLEVGPFIMLGQELYDGVKWLRDRIRSRSAVPKMRR